MFNFLHSGNMQRSLAYIVVNCIPTKICIYHIFVLCTLSSCLNRVKICCRTLSYSLCFNIQTDQVDETEGLEMER
jgi:hypothetical protein